MKKLLLLATLLVISAAAWADDPAEAAFLAKEKATYPLTTCVVSGDSLAESSMAGSVDFIYKQPGKPDRLIRFCCKDCEKSFQKNPAKYLAALDSAKK